MAKIVVVHGAFNELWGPNELKSRRLPAVRDGLWHHGVELADDDLAVCFYGDLFRRAPGTTADEKIEQSRAGIAESLHDMGGDTIAVLGQAANDAAFERTVDMVTIMATEPDLRAKMRGRIEPLIGAETRVLVAHSLGMRASAGRTAVACWRYASSSRSARNGPHVAPPSDTITRSAGWRSNTPDAMSLVTARCPP
jgi:hypothetical protein